MAKFLFKNISCLVTNVGLAAKQGRRPTEADLGLIHDGAVAWDSELDKIIWVGSSKSIPATLKKKNWRVQSCKGLTAYPGLVDAHTHSIFSGDRSREFSMRMQGASYQEIAQAGGGILSTTNATRSSTAKELKALLAKRLANAFSFGVRLSECKSSYGLSVESELLGLQVMHSLLKDNAPDQSLIVPTTMPAHAFPQEYKNNRGAYLQKICTEILPLVAAKKLAKYTDVFCDEGYFSPADTKRIAQAALKLGLSLRIHADELADTGAALLAVELGAHSADHLLKINSEGIRALGNSNTVATLLPGTALYLREPAAPARKLIASGAIVAIASDFNPGTCPTNNLPFIGSLAAIMLGMSTAEIIAAITWNAAFSLRRENEYGALLPGMSGKPVFCEGDHPAALFYRFAGQSLPCPTENN